MLLARCVFFSLEGVTLSLQAITPPRCWQKPGGLSRFLFCFRSVDGGALLPFAKLSCNHRLDVVVTGVAYNDDNDWAIVVESLSRFGNYWVLLFWKRGLCADVCNAGGYTLVTARITIITKAKEYLVQ